MKQLRKASIEALSQTRTLLNGLVTHPQGQKLYLEEGIGKHIRHIIDHFLVLRDGLSSSCIDYNQRNRESELERNIFIASKALDEIIEWVETSALLENDRPVTILSEISCQQTISASIKSNLMRELHYVNYHCIHHLAFCALLAKQQGVDIDPDVGLAPGTASYVRAISG